MRTAGIDIGSITAKAAVLEDGRILGTHVIFTGYNVEMAARKVFDELLASLGTEASSIGKIISTGYGRNSVPFAHKAMTEIICHGAGAHSLKSDVHTVIDVGGQDSKALVVDDAGMVKDFVMNDKCAAGTGRFLEVMARALEVNLDDFGAQSLKAADPSRISSICTVFAESEVISLISKGETRENIIAGIHESVASRVYAMAQRVKAMPPIMMTGGVARNIGVVRALEKKFGVPIEVNEYAQVNGAIGAAVLAAKI
ncbi:MAG TPA: acyl-CoA dehydratase activase [Deltaproteobacteria bacterium]|nr:acyl-CoA dehydratase activase [Deltaproteobacteria bacterium]HPR53683.1 acyl-CoA dehydratase activase [Deltaproteobacteria bacterium]HXK47199.1 acyl-CoA dehydratase activase [Deltaproteobacteria bacterium]